MCLEKVVESGASIFSTDPSLEWRGNAQVTVSTVLWSKYEWLGTRSISGQRVSHIGWRLTEEIEACNPPTKLNNLLCDSFAGTELGSYGYIITREEAAELIALDPKNFEVIYPLFNSDDLNSQVNQQPTRCVINFREMSLAQAQEYPHCLSVLTERVKPYRDTLTKQARGEEGRKSDIPLTNFRGIELRDFPAEIARLALIIAEYHCDVLYHGQKDALQDFLLLDAQNWITCGWPLIFATGYEIAFAHTSFKWANLASHKAVCNGSDRRYFQSRGKVRRLFSPAENDASVVKKVDNINCLSRSCTQCLCRKGILGSTNKANALGMRSMQERAYEKRGEQYILIKSPPASGKSRALMFVALDKLANQGVKQAIIVVPEKSIGSSFADEPLTKCRSSVAPPVTRRARPAPASPT